MAEIHVFGIRHHGPGSARALQAALNEIQPDALAIEMPADLQGIVGHIEDPELIPPVAMVSYDPKAVQHALFYPLARFSPEWVALRWAVTHDVPVVAMDLPASLMIASSRRLRENRKSAGQRAGRNFQRDPLGELAKLAGYADRERWWERTFEIQHGTANLFPAVSAMIATLRQAYPESSDEDCLFREMHMARSVLAMEKTGYQDIGVVCGAWHAPVLAKAELKKTAKGYAAAKRGLTGPKLESTWIPYTYERLRMQGGYGAGVQSPIWYEQLFDQPSAATEQYLSLLARELRAEGHPASTAQVVDAASLTIALAELRNPSLPGLEEIKEAALGSLAEGSEVRLQQALGKVESLRTTGRVPSTISSLPLQRDLEKRLKATRLMKPYREMERSSRDLDLRKPAHREASQLLYQLLLLGIPFGDRQEAARGAQGTFKETWTLHWKPEFALRLLTCHVLGQTIKAAAKTALRERLDAEPELPSLTAAVDLVILAGLFDELDDVTRRIKERTLAAAEVWEIAAALPPLLRLARYPSLRVEETDYIKSLTRVLLPKLASGLLPACQGIDDDAGYDAFRLLKLVQPYLAMEQQTSLIALWHRAMEQVCYGKNVHPLLAGFALRVLSDSNVLNSEQTANWFQANLGGGVLLHESSLFIEGFLYSTGLILIHQPEVFRLFDGWLDLLSEDEFRKLLPAFRRVFSQFSVSERRKMSSLSRRDWTKKNETLTTSADLDGDISSIVRSWLN